MEKDEGVTISLDLNDKALKRQGELAKHLVDHADDATRDVCQTCSFALQELKPLLTLARADNLHFFLAFLHAHQDNSYCADSCISYTTWDLAMKDFKKIEEAPVKKEWDEVKMPEDWDRVKLYVKVKNALGQSDKFLLTDRPRPKE